MPMVELFNGTLRVEQGNGTLWVEIKEEKISPWLLGITAVHLCAKLFLLTIMVRNYRLANNRLSRAFVYVTIAMELKAHSAVMEIYSTFEEEGIFSFGFGLGMAGLAITIVQIFYLPPPFRLWEAVEGTLYYLYIASSG